MAKASRALERGRRNRKRPGYPNFSVTAIGEGLGLSEGDVGGGGRGGGGRRVPESVQFLYWKGSSPVSLSRHVRTMASVTEKGSQLAEGRRSSK